VTPWRCAPCALTLGLGLGALGVAPRCPKCGGALSRISQDGAQAPRADVSLVGMDQVRKMLGFALPFAQVILNRCKGSGLKPYEQVLALCTVLAGLCKAFGFPAAETLRMIIELEAGKNPPNPAAPLPPSQAS